MGKIIARVVGSIFFVLPALSFALGLGPITMRSSLNQPLDAEIDIHSVQPGDLEGLAVRLASVEDFARVNVERASFLTKIRFKLTTRPDGTAYIVLSTKQAVTEPYLDFLIEARWPRGRALKEYTVLVDPPVLMAESPAPVEQASTTPVFSPRQPRPVQQAPRRQERSSIRSGTPPPPIATRRESASVGFDGEINYGRVKRNDTLWEIALETRPSESISIHQMMLAYLRDNPQAFTEGNINKLKSGYVLRIEDASSIAGVSKAEAVSEIRRQNLAWREGRSSRRLVKQTEPEDSVAGDFDNAGSSARGRGAVDEDARLKLVAPGTEDRGSGGATSADSAKELQEDLLLATEVFDANRQESEELQSRFAELEEQFQSMQRLIMFKDEELLVLQNQLGIEPESVNEPEEVAAATEQQDKSEEGLFSDPILMGLGGLLVAAVVGWLVVRRRKMQDGFEESILNVGMAHKAGAEFNDNTVLMNKPPSVAGGNQAQNAESGMVSDFAMSELDGFQGDSADVDPISEADVYLAYGRHQQAEDIITQALEKTPDRLDLQAKLLEVLHAARNVAGFEAQARLLHENIGGDETNPYWTDIVALGRELCPHSDLFGGAAVDQEEMLGVVSDDEQDLLDFDFDAELAQGGDTETVMSAVEEDDALDFDVSTLDFDMDVVEEQVTAEAASGINAPNNTHDDSQKVFKTDTALEPVQQDDASALDFDLSFDHNDNEVVELTEVSKQSAAELDFDGVDLEPVDSVSAIELAVDSSDTINDAALEFDYTADVVTLDTGDNEGELDEDIFSNVDEVGTKLDLAKAYVDMGDSDGARSILDEVLEEGDDSQKQQAEELLQQMG
ncbi:MAG: FimV family protein [Gammaproteobacteria bacterium]|nr:FimV family protein [Gammaproteobacteria bacterium]